MDDDFDFEPADLLKSLRPEQVRAMQSFVDLTQRDVEGHVFEVRRRVADDPSAFAALSDFVAARVIEEGITEAVRNEDVTTLQRTRSAGETVARYGGTRARAAALYLAARAAFALDDVDEAGELLRESLVADEHWYPAVRVYAWFLTVRGDLTKARSVLTTIGEEDADSFWDDLDDALASSGAEPGRNEPCWCGSGRKYKSCHRGTPYVDPAIANQIAYRVVFEYLDASPYAAEFDALCEYRESMMPAGYDPEVDPLPADVLLFEGGAIEHFLTVAADLLPDGAADRYQSWLDRGRGVYDVVAVEPGESVRLRDRTGGDEFEVVEAGFTTDLEVGETLCSRVIESGDHLAFGGVVFQVLPEDVDELTELLAGDPTPRQVIELNSRHLIDMAPAPDPTAGDFRFTVLSLEDVDAVETMFDEDFDADGPGRWTWTKDTDGEELLPFFTEPGQDVTDGLIAQLFLDRSSTPARAAVATRYPAAAAEMVFVITEEDPAATIVEDEEFDAPGLAIRMAEWGRPE